MKSLFFIEIPTQFHTEELLYNWFKKDPNNPCYGCNVLTELKNLTLNCDVILVLPSFNITHQQFKSKIKNRKKLELAISYEFEETLSEEIEYLFFAYHPSQEKYSLDVAIINKAWFEQWLDIFKQHDILLTAAISDIQLLKNAKQDYLLIKNKNCYLLKIPTSCYVIDGENLDYFINQLQESLPTELTLINNSPEAKIPAVPINLKNIPIQGSLLSFLTEHYLLGEGINLLQGIYQPKLKNDWQQIKWAVVGLFGLLLVASGFQVSQNWQLTRQESELDLQRKTMLLESFPKITKTPNPLMQMKTELAKLKNVQQQQGRFIYLLSKVAIALRELIAQEKIALLGMDFDGNILTLKINASSMAIINQTNKNLAGQQLKVEIESSNKTESQITAGFKIMGVIK